MTAHITEYDENKHGTRSWAKCSCGWTGPSRHGCADKTHATLERDSEAHIDQQG